VIPWVPSTSLRGQVFAILNNRQGKHELVVGLSSHLTISANAEKLLYFNRGHWGVESDHNILDWN
jgi:hypothetical protein